MILADYFYTVWWYHTSPSKRHRQENFQILEENKLSLELFDYICESYVNTDISMYIKKPSAYTIIVYKNCNSPKWHLEEWAHASQALYLGNKKQVIHEVNKSITLAKNK